MNVIAVVVDCMVSSVVAVVVIVIVVIMIFILAKNFKSGHRRWCWC